MNPKLASQIVKELTAVCQKHFRPVEPDENTSEIPLPTKYTRIEKLTHPLVISAAMMAAHYHNCSVKARRDDYERSFFFGARSIELQLFAATIARNLLSVPWNEIHITRTGDVYRHEQSSTCVLVSNHRLRTWAQRFKTVMADVDSKSSTDSETGPVITGASFKLIPRDPRIKRVHMIYKDLASHTQHPDGLALAEASTAPTGFLLSALIHLVFASADLFPERYDPMTVNFDGEHIIGKLTEQPKD